MAQMAKNIKVREPILSPSQGLPLFVEPICSFRRMLGGVARRGVAFQTIYRISLAKVFLQTRENLEFGQWLCRCCKWLPLATKKCTAAAYMSHGWRVFSAMFHGPKLHSACPHLLLRRSIAALRSSFRHLWEDLKDAKMLDVVWATK